MEILRTISLYTEGKSLPFLVIGGHAVNAYGILRHTADLDLLVNINSKDKWHDLMLKLNYEAGQNDDRFARYRSKSLLNWPIDLMYVDSETFTKLYEASRELEYGEARAQTVSPRHLALLKIHALKHYQEHRYSKDYSDLETLLRSGKTEITDSELKELCERYATIALYEKLRGN
jgi:hypothetical protein